MSILVFDLERTISDVEGKNLKFRRMRSLRIDPKNISVHFYRSPIKTVGQVPKMVKNQPKNGNDLGNLDLDPMTLILVGYVDLVHTYLPYKYGHDRRSLRQSNVYFKV